jgi:hypothetical protein
MNLFTPFFSKSHPWRTHASGLPTQTQFLNDRPITIHIPCLQVVEESPSLTDQFQKTSSRMMVSLMGLEMLREIADALTQQGDLDF